MALHKILILAWYDEDEFEYYLDAYLDEGQKTLAQYQMDEARDFLGKIRSCIAGYGEDDCIDLYLAQTDKRVFWDFEKDFAEAGMRLSDRTCWTDSQAYGILADLLSYQPKRIALHGKNGAVGSQADPCIRVYCMYCAQPESLQAGTASAESKPPQPKGPVMEEPQRPKGTAMDEPQRPRGTAMDEPQRPKAGNAQPSLASLMRQLAEGRNK